MSHRGKMAVVFWISKDDREKLAEIAVRKYGYRRGFLSMTLHDMIEDYYARSAEDKYRDGEDDGMRVVVRDQAVLQTPELVERPAAVEASPPAPPAPAVSVDSIMRDYARIRAQIDTIKRQFPRKRWKGLSRGEGYENALWRILTQAGYDVPKPA